MTPCFEKGDIDAQVQIASCYYYGRGVQKNSKEALKWFQTAGFRGEGSSQYWCGCILIEGDEFVPRNRTKSWLWFKKAAENGVGKALEALKTPVFSRMTWYSSVKDCVMCLLCIRRFRKKECPLLALLPIDVVVLIGKIFWSWRDEMFDEYGCDPKFEKRPERLTELRNY